jgi:hypothetical protein
MKYRHLSTEQVADLHARSFIGYYFRSRWFAENAHLLWPRLRWLGLRGPSVREPEIAIEPDPCGAPAVPAPTLVPSGERLSVLA